MRHFTKRIRMSIATLMLLASAGWYWRSVDRTVLLPIPMPSGGMGYVNADGRIAISEIFRSAGEFDASGLAIVIRGTRAEFIDRTGRLVEAPDVDHSIRLNEWTPARTMSLDRGKGWGDLIPESSTDPVPAGPWGEVDREGRVVVAPRWETESPADIGLARVIQNRLWGFMDRSGKWVIPPEWTFAGDFDAQGMARVERDHLMGFIDRTGQVVIPLKFQTAEDFDKHGLACVSSLSRYGFIDRSGEYVNPVQWDFARSYAGHPMANVMKDREWGCVDRDGNVIVAPHWDYCLDIHDHGQLFILFTRRQTERPNWMLKIDDLTNGALQRYLQPALLYQLYDSRGRVVWSSSWHFRSWAAWVMIVAGGCMAIDLWRWGRPRRVAGIDV